MQASQSRSIPIDSQLKLIQAKGIIELTCRLDKMVSKSYRNSKNMKNTWVFSKISDNYADQERIKN